VGKTRNPGTSRRSAARSGASRWRWRNEGETTSRRTGCACAICGNEPTRVPLIRPHVIRPHALQARNCLPHSVEHQLPTLPVWAVRGMDSDRMDSDRMDSDRKQEALGIDEDVRVRFRWKLRIRQVTGDTKYGTIPNIRAVEDMGIRAYVPLPDWEHNSAYFGASKFTCDAEHDHYVCPNGQALRRTHTSEAGQRIQYRAQASTCRACPLRAQWTPGTKLGRSVCRFFGEEYVERMRAYQSTAAYQKALRKRQVWVERLFAEAKEWHGLRRFRLRRLWRVNSEALLLAAGQNLKRLLATDGWGRRPLPGGAALALTPSAGSVVCVVCCVWGIVLLEDRHRSGGAAPDTRPVFIAV
jgi:Transposase DDE domain